MFRDNLQNLFYGLAGFFSWLRFQPRKVLPNSCLSGTCQNVLHAFTVTKAVGRVLVHEQASSIRCFHRRRLVQPEMSLPFCRGGSARIETAATTVMGSNLSFRIEAPESAATIFKVFFPKSG